MRTGSGTGLVVLLLQTLPQWGYCDDSLSGLVSSVRFIGAKANQTAIVVHTRSIISGQVWARMSPHYKRWMTSREIQNHDSMAWCEGASATIDSEKHARLEINCPWILNDRCYRVWVTVRVSNGSMLWTEESALDPDRMCGIMKFASKSFRTGQGLFELSDKTIQKRPVWVRGNKDVNAPRLYLAWCELLLNWVITSAPDHHCQYAYMRFRSYAEHPKSSHNLPPDSKDFNWFKKVNDSNGQSHWVPANDAKMQCVESDYSGAVAASNPFPLFVEFAKEYISNDSSINKDPQHDYCCPKGSWITRDGRCERCPKATFSSMNDAYGCTCCVSQSRGPREDMYPYCYHNSVHSTYVTGCTDRNACTRIDFDHVSAVIVTILTSLVLAYHYMSITIRLACGCECRIDKRRVSSRCCRRMSRRILHRFLIPFDEFIVWQLVDLQKRMLRRILVTLPILSVTTVAVNSWVQYIDADGTPIRPLSAYAVLVALILYICAHVLSGAFICGYVTKCWTDRWYATISGGVSEDSKKGYILVSILLLVLDGLGLGALAIFTSEITIVSPGQTYRKGVEPSEVQLHPPNAPYAIVLAMIVLILLILEGFIGLAVVRKIRVYGLLRLWNDVSAPAIDDSGDHLDIPPELEGFFEFLLGVCDKESRDSSTLTTVKGSPIYDPKIWMYVRDYLVSAEQGNELISTSSLFNVPGISLTRTGFQVIYASDSDEERKGEDDGYL